MIASDSQCASLHVIANIAVQKLGGELGDYSLVHPDAHVNCGQFTNDIVPTTGKIDYPCSAERSGKEPAGPVRILLSKGKRI